MKSQHNHMDCSVMLNAVAREAEGRMRRRESVVNVSYIVLTVLCAVVFFARSFFSNPVFLRIFPSCLPLSLYLTYCSLFAPLHTHNTHTFLSLAHTRTRTRVYHACHCTYTPTISPHVLLFGFSPLYDSRSTLLSFSRVCSNISLPLCVFCLTHPGCLL